MSFHYYRLFLKHIVSTLKPQVSLARNKLLTVLVFDRRLTTQKFVELMEHLARINSSIKTQLQNTVQMQRQHIQQLTSQFLIIMSVSISVLDQQIKVQIVYIFSQESAVADGTQCTEECGASFQPRCNRFWQKKNLRRKWHEAGRIRHGRMGSLSGVLKVRC